MELNRIYNEDCLLGLQRLADKSVNLIVIDPPYNIKKAKWDTWKTVASYVEFMGAVFLQCQRVLKDNGSFYFFHNDFLQIVELQNWINKNTEFRFKSFISIDKLDNNYIKDLYGSQQHFRNYLNLAEYALFYTFQDESGLDRIMGDYSLFAPIKDYFRTEKAKIEATGVKVKDVVKWTTHFHSFAQGLSFGMPTEERYRELQEAFKGFFLKDYQELRQEYEGLRQEYEKERFTFNEKAGRNNIWSYRFREDKQTKHPTQKPIKLIEDIIRASSNEGDTVLDCFMGSGTTAIAAINTDRNYIGFEKDATYYALATERIRKHTELKSLPVYDLFSQAV